MIFIMQVGLVSLSFSSLLVCSKLLDSDIILYSFTRAVAWEQQQMLTRLETSIFFKLRFIMQVGLVSLSFACLLVCSKLLDSDIILYSFTRAVAWKQQQMLSILETSSFFQNEIYHASSVCELVILKCASVL